MKKINVVNPQYGTAEVILDDDVYRLLKGRLFGLYGHGNHFYARVGIENHWIPIHKLVCPSPKGYYTDHKNGNQFDNRRKNLRVCDPSQSAANRGYTKHTDTIATSKYKGVRKRRDVKENHRAWTAAIKKGDTRYHLGSFHTEVEAAEAYNQKAKELFGEYARLNIIN